MIIINDRARMVVPWNECSHAQRPTTLFWVLEAAFVFVFSFLWPQYLLEVNGSDHHRENSYPDDDQDRRQYTANNLDCTRAEGLADSERRGDESSVWKDVREPGHAERHSTVLHTGPMSSNRDEEEPERKTPDPQTHVSGDHLDDHSSNRVVAHEASRQSSLCALSHAKSTGYCERSGTHRDKHSRSRRFHW